MNVNDARHLQNIISLLERLIRDTQSLSYENFVADPLLLDASAMKLIAVGEQVNRVSDETLEKYPHIPWRAIRGLRNRFAHDYFAIDNSMLWDILSNDVADLKKQLVDVLERGQQCDKGSEI
jgi:uncharacterized protein with HEPN domain